MVQSVVLAKCGLSVSRLGLGLSRLHYLSSTEAQALISTAIQCGVHHFDTAPLYGDGLSEEILGAVLGREKSLRRTLTVATKFGLLPNRMFGGGIRGRLLRAGRGALRRGGFAFPPKVSFSAKHFEESFMRSLKSLRTDYVDFLLLHEPQLSQMPEADALFSQLARARERGAVRAVGIAMNGGDPGALLSRYAGVIEVVQAPENDAYCGQIADITFGAISAKAQSYGARGVMSETACARVHAALEARPDKCVLVGTTKRSHLREVARLAS